MAEIIANEGGGKHKGKRRAKKLSTHIDMTPMVDLACLMLTFFMLTTAFAKPKIMEIVLPDNTKPKDPPPEVNKSRVVNIILDENNKVYWYQGKIEANKPLPVLVPSNFSKDGIRKMVLERNKDIFNQIEQLREDVLSTKLKISRDSLTNLEKAVKRKDNTGPVFFIKATDKAKYGNFVDIVDEMAIGNAAHYSITDMNAVELKMLAAAKGLPAPSTADNKKTK
jgi:biopolymer transport protein ExbD